MAKVPACAKAFVGRWRIAEMDVWDNDFLDLVEEAHLTLKGTADGEIVFGALKGFFDVRYGAATARPAQSSRGKATMRTIQHAVVDGLSLAPQDAWSATSTSTTATIQASYASAPDFFNSLLRGAASVMPPACRRVGARALLDFGVGLQDFFGSDPGVSRNKCASAFGRIHFTAPTCDGEVAPLQHGRARP